MRVLHVISNMSQGGAQKLLFDILSQNAAKKSAVFILNRKNNIYSDQLEKIGVKVYSNSNAYFSLKNFRILKSLLKDYKIVHSHLFQAQYFVALFFSLNKRYSNIKKITTEHSTFNRRRKLFLRPLEKFVYSKYNYIIAISDGVKSSLNQWLKMPSKLLVIPNGIILKFSVNNYLNDFETKKKNKNINLLMVARFTQSKNHRMLIDCMKKLPKNYHLFLLGDGELLQKERKYVELNKMSSRINFVGYSNNILSYYEKADIYIQASNWEGFGLATVEAMSYGLPVIATDVEGLREVVDKCGPLIPNNDVDRLCNSIIDIIKNPSELKRMSNCSYMKSKEFSINKMVDTYYNLYKKVIPTRS